MTTRLAFEAYLDHLARESARFSDALAGAPPDARVPTCPDWDAVDLLWHLGEVQWFWQEIVHRRITDNDEVGQLEATRPGDHAAIGKFFERASRDLHDALRRTPPETAAWTWSAEQTVGFTYRRQAHEAFIHRLDAELTAGRRTAMDAALGADGVDEALRIMYGGLPPWGTFAPDGGRTLRLETADTGHSWLVTLVRFTGTDPADNSTHDEPDISVAPDDLGGAANATVRADAADLDCWLWHRPPVGAVERVGDADVLERFEATIRSGLN